MRLFGPYEATRATVLWHLMLHSYDVLHFAGHCVYDEEHPEDSGWIFSGGKRLSADELSRIDRVPSFVFSNACESGITPDRSGLRSVDLAPSFAERFFDHGVTNFVCTAWPVDDVAARTFALSLYANQLGLSSVEAQETRYESTPPQSMRRRQAGSPARHSRRSRRRTHLGGISALRQPLLSVLRPGDDVPGPDLTERCLALPVRIGEPSFASPGVSESRVRVVLEAVSFPFWLLRRPYPPTRGCV